MMSRSEVQTIVEEVTAELRQTVETLLARVAELEERPKDAEHKSRRVQDEEAPAHKEKHESIHPGRTKTSR